MPRNAPIWVKILLFVHLFAITVWAFPVPPSNLAQNAQDLKEGKRKPNPIDLVGLWNRNNLRNGPVRYYIWATATWQYWDMFSPNPLGMDIYCTADIEYEDGTTKTYLYPRMYTLSLTQKYIEERYRKFYERAGDMEKSYLWPTFAQRIAQKNWTDPKNKPVKVTLHKWTRVVRAPGKKQLNDFIDTTYFVYYVQPDALEVGKK